MPPLPRIRVSRLLQQQQQKQATNPFSERGLEKFSQVYEELNAKRKIIAAQTGAEISLVRFRSKSTTGEWVPILPRAVEDVEDARSPEIFTPSLDDPENLRVDVASCKKFVGKSSWAACAKAQIVCFIRNKSWMQISRFFVTIIITTVFLCTGKMMVVAAIAAMLVCVCAWKHFQTPNSSSPTGHPDILIETPRFLHNPTQSAPPSPKYFSKARSLNRKTNHQKSRSQDLIASTSTAAHKGLDQTSRKRTRQRGLKSQTPPPSAGGMGSFLVLVLMSVIVLGRIPAILFTVFCFVLMNTSTLRSSSTSQTYYQSIEESAVERRPSKSKATATVTFSNKPAIIHSNITSSEYRKRVIIEGLLERPNRW